MQNAQIAKLEEVSDWIQRGIRVGGDIENPQVREPTEPLKTLILTVPDAERLNRSVKGPRRKAPGLVSQERHVEVEGQVRRLTVSLSGRTQAHPARRERIIAKRARGA